MSILMVAALVSTVLGKWPKNLDGKHIPNFVVDSTDHFYLPSDFSKLYFGKWIDDRQKN